MAIPPNIAVLDSGRRIWAIGAIHGEVNRLQALHGEIAASFAAGDQIVYLGNYGGYGPAVRETFDELVEFRDDLLAVPGVRAQDLVHLRGAQEEMWQKLLQLHLAPDPEDVLNWMVEHGLEPTISAYGARAEDGLAASRQGAVSVSLWTGKLRDNFRMARGHDGFFAGLRHAAVTADQSILFVSAGLNPHRGLTEQGDQFWWGSTGFETVNGVQAYPLVVRGHDPKSGGVAFGTGRITLDGGAGRGGHLAGTLIEAGRPTEVLRV